MRIALITVISNYHEILVWGIFCWSFGYLFPFYSCCSIICTQKHSTYTTQIVILFSLTVTPGNNNWAREPLSIRNNVDTGAAARLWDCPLESNCAVLPQHSDRKARWAERWALLLCQIKVRPKLLPFLSGVINIP